MILGADEGGRLVAHLSAEAGLAALADPRTPVLLWREDRDVPIWLSEGGRDLMARAPRALDGSPALPPATAARLRTLAGGAAPRTGLRLERLRWNAMDPPLTLVCRLGSLEGRDVLMTAFHTQASPSKAERARTDATPADHQAELARGLGGERPRRGERFMWRTDGEGRFTEVSADLARLVGPRGAAVLGMRWSDLVGRLVEDRGALADAFARGVGWSRRSVGWRDPDAERLVPVELSGAPIAGEDEGPSGFRGFGVAYPERARPIAPGSFADMPEPSPALEADLLASASEVPDPTPEPIAEDEATEDRHALSTSERGALHEIARALRNGPGDGGREGAVRASADIIPLPQRPRAEPAALLDQLPVAAVVLREGVPLFANRRLLDALGFPDLPKAVARGSLHALAKLAPEDAAPGTVSLLGEGGVIHAFEGRSGRVDWGETAADLVLLSPPAAAPAAVIEALRLDLAARDGRLEEARAALDLAADGVATLDASARLLSLTRSAERLFGLSANEVVGDSFTALLEPRDHRTALACLDALRTGPSGGVQSCEVRGRTRGGATIPLAMRAGHAPSGGGFVAAFTDVTHSRLLEDDLREARESAEEASANRADFLARISHEVRTPLTAITGFAELMLEERFGPLGNERYRGYIRDIRDSGVHVISLVNDLLDLAKATSGAQDLSPAVLDLNAVVQQCVALAAPLAAQEKTIVRTSFAAGLPRTFADERSVRQIVINLLSNAIRFTGAGGQVIVSTAASGTHEVVLSIRDTGPGMSEDEVATALTPFRQVSATRRGDGTGLGMPLSKALTEANGGVFLVTSAPDLGTLVEVKLPVEARGAVAAE